MDIEFPPDLVDLQRASHAAWDAVEAHRKAVDADRRAGVVAETDPTRPTLREWTEDEDAEHARLMAAATEAAQALRAGLAKFATENPGHSHYDLTQQLHKAARAEA